MTPSAPCGLRAALAALCLVGLWGCPQPVATASSPAPRASRLPVDAVVVLEAPRLERAQAVLARLLGLVDAPGGLAVGLRGRLGELVGADPTRSLWLSLAGVDQQAPVAAALRPTGELVLDVGIASPRRFSTALEAVVGRRGGEVRADDADVLTLLDEAGQASMLVRTLGDRALLWPVPDDELAARALLGRLGEERFSLPEDLGRPPPPPGGRPRVDVALWTRPGARAALGDEGLAAFLPPEGRWVPGWLGFEAIEAGLVLRGALPREGEDRPAPLPDGACLDWAGAMADATLPAELLPTGAPDELSRLVGPLRVALFPPAEGAPLVSDDPFSVGRLLLLGRPPSPQAAEALMASFVQAAGEGQITVVDVAGVPVRRLAPGDGAPWRVLEAAVGPGRFVLSTGHPDALAKVLAGGPCPPQPPGARLRIDGRALHASLAREALRPDGEASPPAALRRLVGRIFAGVAEVEGSLSPAPSAWALRLEIHLAGTP